MNNLIAYGLGTNEDKTTVESALSEIEGSIRKFKSDKHGFDKIANDLKAIKQAVEVKEHAFYKSLNVNNYEDLNDKIKQLENRYDIFLPDGAIIREIKNKFDFSKIKNATDKELADAIEYTVNDFLEQELQNNEQLFNEFLGKSFDGSNDGVNALLGYLQNSLTVKNSKSGKKQRFITSRTLGGSKQKVGLGKVIVDYNEKNNNVQVSVEEIQNLSHGFRKKVEEDLTQMAYQINHSPSGKINVYDLDRATYREYINSIIHKHYKAPINIIKEQYDLNRSIASTIGYLGEVRATLLMKELVPNAQVRATGNLYTDNLRDRTKRGWEIPIDLICAANGFQIKNYTLDDNSVSFSNSMTVPKWIEGRLKLTGSIAETLIALFGIYQYNQPLHSSDSSSLPQDLDQYKEVYGKIEGSFQELNSLFDARIPEMLKIVDEFSVSGDPLLHSKKLYFNTFFWINRHLVPSSWILEQLINEMKRLSKSAQGKTIQSSYSFLRSDHDSKMRFQKTGLKYQKSGLAPGNLLSAASKVRVNYQITIDLTHFVNL